MTFFVFNVIHTSYFFFLKQVAEIYEQISRCISRFVGCRCLLQPLREARRLLPMTELQPPS